MAGAERDGLDPCFDCLTEPALAGLADELGRATSLGVPERQALLAGTADALTSTVRRKVTRVLLLELNAARTGGTLTAPTSEARWDEFVARAAEPGFWTGLAEHYPTLAGRLATVIHRRCAAALELGRRITADRQLLAEFLGEPEPELRRVSFGAGDSHRGGRSVALLGFGARTVVYKPRSLAIDRALATLLSTVFAGRDDPEPLRVPAVCGGPDHGWAEFVEHRYCDGAAELDRYYTRLGQWLAIARLLGATDLHAENLIACGPQPVVVDCETLFSPQPTAPPSGLGNAVDRAAESLANTVLRSGLLPGRGAGLGWRGVDISAAGALPGQQPLVEVPQLVGAGTDQAHLGFGPMPPLELKNHPSPQPQLSRYWPAVLAGFEDLTGWLGRLDRAGALAEPLSRFADVEMRVVLRATEAYAELSRMLWHPVSLHDEPTAVARATELLVKQSEFSAFAPSDPAVVAAEVADLLVGDVPFFDTRPADGRLRGPGGTGWGPSRDLVADTLHRWRTGDLEVEREVIRTTLVSAYLNDGWQSASEPLPVPDRPLDRLEPRRRRLAADIMRDMVAAAIRGDDGTVTWIAPSFNVTGWSVQPLGPDGYSGAAGVAVLLAGYLHEAAAGRATPVPGVPELLRRMVRSRQLSDDVRQRDLSSGFQTRPGAPGLYVGLASEIWSWLRLMDLGTIGDEGLHRATGLAEQLPRAIAESTEHDVLIGTAGSIVALLELAGRTGDRRWLEVAESAGDQLRNAAKRERGTARWCSERSPDGIGGFAHGATGIGWALARLAAATGRAELGIVADEAFAFEETLYLPGRRGWRDARDDEQAVATAWCHGATGIGLASADLVRRGATGATDHADVVRRAAAAAWAGGMGWNHTICHGDLGCWELLDVAIELGLAPDGLSRSDVAGYIVSSIERHGPVSGVAREAFAPGLLPGLGGIAYQLLRMHPECDLGSVLILD